MNVIGSILPDSSPSRLPAPRQPLTRRQKAAIVVRLLLAEGEAPPLSDLPEDVQAALTEEMARMRSVDRDTVSAVVEEFLAELDSVGLSFPGGLGGALSLLQDHLSSSALTRLRRIAATTEASDPWERITALPAETLVPVLEQESTEVGAVMLSKLAVSKAADILGRLPGERARRIAYAMSLTGSVRPDAVARIGQAIVAQLDDQPPRAFDSGPVERVGAILNFAPSTTRDEVLLGLEETDAAFAEEVRKAIFTFTNIPTRIAPRDIPKILRSVDQAVLVKALAGATGPNALAAEFILANISQRMAASLRDEMQALGKQKDKDIDEAMAGVVSVIREMEAAGEIYLLAADEAEVL